MQQKHFLIELLESLGFRINREKSELIPSHHIPFLGFVVDTIQNVYQPSNGKDSFNPVHGNVSERQSSISSSQNVKQIYRYVFSHSSGSFPSPSSLQTTEVCEKFSFTKFFKSHRSLRQLGILNRESQERPGLVGKSPSISLLSTNKFSTPLQGNNFRCFRLWLGDLVRWGAFSVSLVRRRDKVAHKSERIDGRFYWPKAICQMSALPYSHSSSSGQHNSSSLCEENRGHYFFRSMYASPSYVGMGRGKKHSSVSCISSRSAELNSRHSFLSDRSRFRVDVKPFNILTSLFNLQYSESRPVCYPSEQPSSKFCVLVPRSRSNGDKCIHSSLVRSSELCLSPIQSDYEVSEKDPDRQSQGPFCGSSVEIETMGPGPSFNAVRSPTIVSECFGSVNTTILPREAPADTSDSGPVALSGDVSQSLVFLQGCPKLSFHPGDQVLKLNIEVLGQNGVAGVSSSRKIIFLVI